MQHSHFFFIWKIGFLILCPFINHNCLIMIEKEDPNFYECQVFWILGYLNACQVWGTMVLGYEAWKAWRTFNCDIFLIIVKWGKEKRISRSNMPNFSSLILAPWHPRILNFDTLRQFAKLKIAKFANSSFCLLLFLWLILPSGGACLSDSMVSHFNPYRLLDFHESCRNVFARCGMVESFL